MNSRLVAVDGSLVVTGGSEGSEGSILGTIIRSGVTPVEEESYRRKTLAGPLTSRIVSGSDRERL